MAYRMTGANLSYPGQPNARAVTIAPNSHGPNTGLNGVTILDTAAAISKIADSGT